MLRYLLLRLLLFVPVLLVISLLAFLISVNAPGDPVKQYLESQGADPGQLSASAFDRSVEEKKLREAWGLDLPHFYFSLRTAAHHDSLKTLADDRLRIALKRWMHHTGRPEMVWLHFIQGKEIYADSSAAADSKNAADLWLLNPNESQTWELWQAWMQKMKEGSAAQQWSKATWEAINQPPKWWTKFVPVFAWHGRENQYHRWLLGDGAERKGAFRGDFGISYRDGQAISTRIGSRVKWSAGLAFFSILLAYLISLPIGVSAAKRAGSWFDKISGSLLYLLFAFPVFFTGTLLLVFFANPDFLDWFPSGGVRDASSFNPEWPFWERLSHYAPYLVLPVITYSVSAWAFIASQTRSAMIASLQQPYIRTARAMGISENTILWRHAFRNALLPIITMLSASLPALFAGSIIIEVIFNIPGMGLEIMEAISAYDYPMIVAVFTIFGLLTLLGNFLADLLYALADPRIRFQKSS